MTTHPLEAAVFITTEQTVTVWFVCQITSVYGYNFIVFVCRFPITFLQSSIKFTNEPPLGKNHILWLSGLCQLIFSWSFLLLVHRFIFGLYWASHSLHSLFNLGLLIDYFIHLISSFSCVIFIYTSICYFFALLYFHVPIHLSASGMKAGLKRTFNGVTQDQLEISNLPQWKPLLFAVAFLHTTVQVSALFIKITKKKTIFNKKYISIDPSRIVLQSE